MHRAALRKMHPKAVHVVFAVRLGFDGSDEKWSDDGEPAGSSAPPVLNLLRSRELVHSAILVVRYFGGKKLGVPGLIHAYRMAAEQALDAAGTIVRKIMDTYAITCNEPDLQVVLHAVHRLPVAVTELQYGERCNFKIRFEKGNAAYILSQLENIWQADCAYLFSD